MKKIDRISIIDDDPITVFGVQKMLNLCVDCNDITAYVNGKTAIDGITERFEKTKQLPEVIFLDINMPIMDGWQFLEEFLTLPSSDRVRINIITSSIDEHDKQQWLKFQKTTHHLITFNNKPLQKLQIEEITVKA